MNFSIKIHYVLLNLIKIYQFYQTLVKEMVGVKVYYQMLSYNELLMI